MQDQLPADDVVAVRTAQAHAVPVEGGVRTEILLSNYGEGALGVLTFGRGELAVVVTLFVFYIGIKFRLKSEDVGANVEKAKETSAEHIHGE